MTTIAAMPVTAGRAELQGGRTVLVFCGGLGTVLKLLDDLTDEEIAAKLPVQLRHLPRLAA